MDNQYAVEVDNVSMRFNMSSEKFDSLKEYFIRLFQRRLFYEEFWALQEVSIKVKRGGMFGLIGFNGAGKSTLLKIVAGVLKPTTGEVKVHGTIAPLIELGAGFDEDLSAKENVYLNGAVLGYPEAVMRERYDAIIDFSELHDFQNVQLKNFSSGMRIRLAFSVATAVRPDILIADEILAVGDFKFQEKCLERIHGMIAEGTTVLFVSHSLKQVMDHCDEVAWMDHGRVLEVGPVKEVCEKYMES